MTRPGALPRRRVGELSELLPAHRQFIPDSVLHPALLEGIGPLHEQTHALGKLGQWCFETMTPIRPGTYRAAREAVDIALTAVDLVLGGERLVYGLCRPPGHHAPRAAFGGYCYFNNAAIAAEALVRAGRGPVAILDVDVHHGNGTQQIFYARGDVLYVSLHAIRPGPTPTSRASPRRSAREPPRARTSTCRSRRASATLATRPRWPSRWIGPGVRTRRARRLARARHLRAGPAR